MKASHRALETASAEHSLEISHAQPMRNPSSNRFDGDSARRFKFHNSAYPEKLEELTNVAPKNLIDFADGQSLRYRRTEDGHFLLYLDFIDNRWIGAVTNAFVRPIRPGVAQGQNTDIIWPLPTQFPKANPQESEE